jgi:DNA phosphorothioation-dependent restriction protein DptG
MLINLYGITFVDLHSRNARQLNEMVADYFTKVVKDQIKSLSVMDETLKEEYLGFLKNILKKDLAEKMEESKYTTLRSLCPTPKQFYDFVELLDDLLEIPSLLETAGPKAAAMMEKTNLIVKDLLVGA